MIRASAYERQGQYQQAEEDFWRAVWSGNSKAGGYYGLAPRSGGAPNQEVLCLQPATGVKWSSGQRVCSARNCCVIIR
ncbi:hypothetical protein DMI65_22170 [Escherichia coli]|nr:hypothetical protein [Escherichia coli]